MYRLLALLYMICAVNGSRIRIIGGVNARIEDAPYQVDILTVSMRHVCGGSILSKNYILTAGHCVDKPRGWYFIRVGSSNSTSNVKVKLHNVFNITRHEDFSQDKWARNDHDIALLKISPPLELNNKTKSAIQLIDRPVKTGDIGFLTGWGSVKEDGQWSQILQSLLVNVTDTKKCEDNYRKYDGLKSYNFCAQHPSKAKDMCNGDSGGPLVIDNKLAGIVSWSAGCAVADYPGVYVDVYKYVDWIHKHMVY